jgi:multiple antibiotic resistance protein
MMHSFWICFVPLFVAVDALGTMPIFMGMIKGVDPARVPRILMQSVITATVVALSFLAVGTVVMRLLGITVADFMVAGGVLLFAISMFDLLSVSGTHHVEDLETLGAVPLGVPLIAGPALFTTSLLLLQQQGLWPTALAVIVNIVLAGVLFRAAGVIYRVLGKAGAKTVSKIANLLLAAIAVMIIRKGLVAIIAGMR